MHQGQLERRALRRRPRRGFAFPVLLGIVAFALPAIADDPPGAPPGQYRSFNVESATIDDLKTHLRWVRQVPPNRVTFAVAQSSCPSGMRLPTLKELLTLVDEQPHEEFNDVLAAYEVKMIDPFAFDGLAYRLPVDDTYWTASANGSTSLWTVDFKDGKPKSASRGDSRYFRCVTTF